MALRTPTHCLATLLGAVVMLGACLAYAQTPDTAEQTRKYATEDENVQRRTAWQVWWNEKSIIQHEQTVSDAPIIWGVPTGRNVVLVSSPTLSRTEAILDRVARDRLESAWSDLVEFEGGQDRLFKTADATWKYTKPILPLVDRLSGRGMDKGELLSELADLADVVIYGQREWLDRTAIAHWPKVQGFGARWLPRESLGLRSGLITDTIEIGGQFQTSINTMVDVMNWAESARAQPRDLAVGFEGVSLGLGVAAMAGGPAAPVLLAASKGVGYATEVGREVRAQVLHDRTMSMIEVPALAGPVQPFSFEQSIDARFGSGSFYGATADGGVKIVGSYSLQHSHPVDEEWRFRDLFRPRSHYTGFTRTTLDDQVRRDRYRSRISGTITNTWGQYEGPGEFQRTRTRREHTVTLIRTNGAEENRRIQEALNREGQRGSYGYTDPELINRMMPRIPDYISSPPPPQSGAPGEKGVSMKTNVTPESFTEDKTGRLSAIRARLLEKIKKDKAGQDE